VTITARNAVRADEAIEALRGADVGKTQLPDPRAGEIWMAGPIAATSTTRAVLSGGGEHETNRRRFSRRSV